MTGPQRIGNDELERHVLTNIAEFGWHSVNVVEDDGHPPWTFTIGLFETWQHPELIILGRARATAHHILNTVATGLDDNRRYDLNLTTTDLLPGSNCCFIEVATRYYHDHVGFARWFYRGKPFPLYQIVWPNTDGHYPWHPHAPDSFKQWQPLLGEAPNGA
jgi:Domain of unknown function (DUF4262)